MLRRSDCPSGCKRALTLVASVGVFVVLAAVSVLTASAAKDHPTWVVATSYTRHPPRFKPRRTIRVHNQARLAAAVAKLRPGDRIEATTSFTVSEEFVIAKRLAAPGAEIDLGEGKKAVRFDYEGESNLPAVWIHDARNIRIFGGDVTNPKGGTGITIYGDTSSVVWWGFSVHDTAGAGITAFPARGPIDTVDLEGDITRWGLKPELDPHAEKGTGTHAANLGDVPGGVFTNNRIAIHAWNGPGDAIEIGNPDETGKISGNTLILEARWLTFRAEEQVAGNGLQLWGGVPIGADVPYLVTRSTQGRALDANGVYRGVSMAGVTVHYGHATACCLNPRLHRTEATLRPAQAWDTRAGVAFLHVGVD
jgi:hypothetical protein